MPKIKIYSEEIESIFELLGYKEDSITYSTAWVLSKSDIMLEILLRDIFGPMKYELSEVQIIVQESEPNTGRTDIEVTDNNSFHLIIEAKKGWVLPAKEQLLKYSIRESFTKSVASEKVIVTLSECDRIYASHYLQIKEANGIPIKHISWKDVYAYSVASYKDSNHEIKKLLLELQHYLGRLMTMQDQNSNLVFVVSLGASNPIGCDLSWIEIVTKKNRYFHPVGHNWPKEPPTYIAFRYAGRLQSIHHIDSYVVSKNIHHEVEEVPSSEQEWPHFVYTMGPAILPQQLVRTGNLFRAQRVWAHLDALLICETIAEARDVTKKRVGISRDESIKNE